MAFQLVTEGFKNKTKRTFLAQTSFYFPTHCLCAAWILPNALLAHGTGPAAGNAGEYSRGICIILHIQSGSALSAAWLLSVALISSSLSCVGGLEIDEFCFSTRLLLCHSEMRASDLYTVLSLYTPASSSRSSFHWRLLVLRQPLHFRLRSGAVKFLLIAEQSHCVDPDSDASFLLPCVPSGEDEFFFYLFFFWILIESV